MGSVKSAKIPLILADRVSGHIAISLLPKQHSEDSAPSLIEEPLTSSPVHELSFQLLEQSEYRYEINVEGLCPQSWCTDRPEIFQADTAHGRTGRVRTGSYTGWLPVTIFSDTEPAGTISLEVRSRKLNYLNEYQWMMTDLAEELAEVVMYHFAAAEQRFSIDDTRDAVTLYQRFAFLRSLVANDGFKAAVSEITKRPHISWEELHEDVRPGQGMKGTSRLVRQVAKPGQRSPWPSGLIATIPHKLDRSQTEASLDTTPNRFVKFALSRWRGVVSQISDIIEEEEETPARKRGLRETKQVLDELDSILSEELFREVGPLYRFPADNQVLQKREGYREILRAYIQFEVASKLAWSGGEEVYGAGQRNVATLYEYWVFLKLAQVISDLCDAKFRFSNLIDVQRDGLNVSLRKGKTKVLTGTVARLGRDLTIELWFNRTYPSSKLVGSDTSWSEQMRPDYTLRISPVSGRTEFEPVLLHFDAKYRLQVLEDFFGCDDKGVEPSSADNASERDDEETVLRSDLLKMHAYRDAIRRSAGAYVIYPGTGNDVRREYHELLPGLGAFALRPTETGTGDGSETIKEFITDILDHVASQLTQHERGRFWLREVFERSSPSNKRAPIADFLVAPPADTKVLLGYVKNTTHWEWIAKTHNYNLRADSLRGGSVGLSSKELSCDLVVLYCPQLNKTSIAQIIGVPQLRTREEMLASGYPSPRGNQYYCIELDFLKADRWQMLVTSAAVEKMRLRRSSVLGAPISTTWFELIAQLA